MTDLKPNEFHFKDSKGTEIEVTASNLKEAWKQAISQCLLETNKTLQAPISVTTSEGTQTINNPPLDNEELEQYYKWLNNTLDVIANNNKRLVKAVLEIFK